MMILTKLYFNLVPTKIICLYPTLLSKELMIFVADMNKYYRDTEQIVNAIYNKHDNLNYVKGLYNLFISHVNRLHKLYKGLWKYTYINTLEFMGKEYKLKCDEALTKKQTKWKNYIYSSKDNFKLLNESLKLVKKMNISKFQDIKHKQVIKELMNEEGNEVVKGLILQIVKESEKLGKYEKELKSQLEKESTMLKVKSSIVSLFFQYKIPKIFETN